MKLNAKYDHTAVNPSNPYDLSSVKPFDINSGDNNQFGRQQQISSIRHAKAAAMSKITPCSFGIEIGLRTRNSIPSAAIPIVEMILVLLEGDVKIALGRESPVTKNIVNRRLLAIEIRKSVGSTSIMF